MLFWGIFFLMAGIGNLLDLLNKIEHRGKYFRFSTSNYELLRKVTSKYTVGDKAITGMFVTIMCWEFISAFSYFVALAFFLQGITFFAQYAFFIGIGLFAALTLGNEAGVFSEVAEEHIVMLLAQLVSYVAVAFLTA
jgi:hypothetical protein